MGQRKAKRKKRLKIKHHYFPYHRCLKINTYIERYNRTIQEEFIDRNEDIIHDKSEFNEKLADYIIFYNTERPDKSLGLKSPVEYLIENGGMSQMSLTYIRWYLPKGTGFGKISKQEIAHIESLINNRPRKCLGFKTPLEVASSFVALQG